MLTNSGREICNSLATLLLQSVSSDLDYKPVEEEVSEKYINKVITNHGFKHISSGTGRRVYRIPDTYHTYSNELVIKFARPTTSIDDPLSGTKQNETEIEIWNFVEDSNFESYFVPVLDSDTEHKFVIMPEANREIDNYKEKLNTLQNKLKNFQWKPETAEYDIGILNEQVVFLDYGIVNEFW